MQKIDQYKKIWYYYNHGFQGKLETPDCRWTKRAAGGSGDFRDDRTVKRYGGTPPPA
jgi:hypothetical protein